MICFSPFDEFVRELRTRLAQPLPGEEAQNRMTSRPGRFSTAQFLQQRSDYRNSAVLLLAYPGPQGPCTALIVRPEYEGVHSGQLALPGGRHEPGDASLIQTALRETQEEIGIDVQLQQVIGALTPLYIPVSNYLVHPFVAALPARPHFIADPKEVSAVLEVPLSLFVDPSAKARKAISAGGGANILAPCYMVQERVLWGATAMMFSELEAILEGK